MGTAWVVVLVGAWMVISPFALHFSNTTAGMVNNIAVGIALIVVTLASAKSDLLRGFLIMLAGWMYTSSVMIVVPGGVFLWNNLLLGVVVIVCAVASSSPYPDNYVPAKK